MNNITYYDHPLYANEAFYLLDNFANNSGIELHDIKLLKEGIDAKEYLDTIKNIKENHSFDSLKLFKHLNVSKLSIAKCLFCFLNEFELESNDSQNILINKINNTINSRVNDINVSDYIEIIPGDEETFINKFLVLNISSEIKINLLKELNHPDNSIKLIYKDILKIIPTLKDLFNKYNNNDCKKYYTKEFITSLIQDNFNSKEEDFIVVPNISSPTTIRLNVHDEHDINPLPSSLHVGLLIDHNKLEEENCSNDKLEESLGYFVKVLNDKSKMNIVELLKDKDMYGAQIAQSLNLKTPTISHHMEILINSGIITITKIDNKVIYSYNKEKCMELIDYLKTKFI